MNIPDDTNEEKALNALIAAAFHTALPSDKDLFDLSKPEPQLGPDELASIKKIKDKIASGKMHRKQEPSRYLPAPECEEANDLMTAMNRSNDEDALSDKARSEMQRKIEEERKKKAGDDEHETE